MFSEDPEPDPNLERNSMVMERAKRLVLNPIESNIATSFSDELLNKLSKIALHKSLPTQAGEEIQWWCGVDQLTLGIFNYCLPDADRGVLEGVFSYPENPEDRNNPNLSEAALLHYLVFQLSSKAICNGWVLAFTEDCGKISWIEPNQFRFYCGGEDYELPLPHDWWSIKDSCDQFTNWLGAEKVWFVLARDLQVLGDGFSTKAKNDEKEFGKNRRVSGYIPESEARREDTAVRLIDDFHGHHEGKRISEAKAAKFIVSAFQLSGKGFSDRVWPSRKNPKAVKVGRISKKEELTTSELQIYYEKNLTKYEASN